MKSASSTRTIAQNDIVDFLYRLVLSRPADPEAVAYWLERFDSGIGLIDCIEALWRSPEFELGHYRNRYFKLPAPPIRDTAPSQGYYFYHIPKTAGMSVTRFLEVSFPNDWMCPWWLWDQIIGVPVEQLNRYRIYRGHFLGYLEPHLGRTLTKMTVLREPLTRTISHYTHVRRAPEHPFHSLARSLSLLDFCLHPDTRHMVQNYQAYYLVNLTFSPSALAKSLTCDDLASFRLQTLLERRLADLSNADGLYACAVEQLDTFAAVGVTERLSDTLAHFSRIMGCERPVEIPEVNVSTERTDPQSLDEATLKTIRELTEVDRLLHQYAYNRLDKAAAVT